MWISGPDAATLYTNWDLIQDLFVQANRKKGGIIETLPDGEPITYLIESIHITAVSEDHVPRKLIRIEFEFACRPYGLLAPIQLVVGHALNGPVDAIDLAAVPGHVDALADVELTDISGQARRDIEWGIAEKYAPTDPMIIDQVAFNTTGFAGFHFGPVVTCQTDTNWIAAFGIDPQQHIGRYRIKLRVAFTSLNGAVRLIWQKGNGEYRCNYDNINRPTLAGQQMEVDLGVIESESSWRGRIEIMGLNGIAGETTNFFKIIVMPADRRGRTRLTRVEKTTPSNFLVSDRFNQAAANLTGQTSSSGHIWSGIGSSTDWQIDEVQHVATRIAFDTGLDNGRWCMLGSNQTNIAVKSDIAHHGSIYGRFGVLARFVDAALGGTWLGLFAVYGDWNGGIQLRKRVGGGATELIQGWWKWLPPNTGWTLYLWVFDNGAWTAAVGAGGGITVLGRGIDTDLASGGPLASGKVGIYGANTDVNGYSVTMNNFASWVPTAGEVLPAGGSLHITSEKATIGLTDDVLYEGDRLKIPPATYNADQSRLVIKQDRSDLTLFPPTDAGDDLLANVTVTPRVLLASKNLA
jgi:hypothetical protein